MIVEKEYKYHCDRCGKDFDEPKCHEDYESIDVGCGARLKVADLSYCECPYCGSDSYEECEDKIICDICGNETDDDTLYNGEHLCDECFLKKFPNNDEN